MVNCNVRRGIAVSSNGETSRRDALFITGDTSGGRRETQTVDGIITIMRFRWWNSFNVLAVVLLSIGVAGACSGGKMVFDPGRAASGKEWLIYLVAGVLMLGNGFLPPANPVEDDENESNNKKPRGR